MFHFCVFKLDWSVNCRFLIFREYVMLWNYSCTSNQENIAEELFHVFWQLKSERKWFLMLWVMLQTNSALATYSRLFKECTVFFPHLKFHDWAWFRDYAFHSLTLTADFDCVTEHVKLRGGRKSATPDYSKLLNDTIYVHRILGNIMFNGKLIQASTNFGCFMTLSNGSAVGSQIPESFKVK
jgi:hypothetical protein